MRRLLVLIALHIAFCYFGAVVTAFTKDTSTSTTSSVSENDASMRLSLNEETLRGRPSTAHTFANLELLNIHPTDDIMIHSIQTAPEETIMVRSASGEVVHSSWENIPQQIHISRLPSGSLSLGPGQLAIVPLTFLPRYPDLESDAFRDGSAWERETATVSAASKIDLVDLIGSTAISSFEKARRLGFKSPSRRRSNLGVRASGEEFEVRTSIVVDTSRGVVSIPIMASSFRENDYSLPDEIKFYDSKYIHQTHAEDGTTRASEQTLQEMGIVGNRLLEAMPLYSNSSNAKGRLTRKTDLSRDCYDIYLSNPSLETEIEVVEILVSRPDLMSVQYDSPQQLFSPTTERFSVPPSQVVREWSHEGPLYIPANSIETLIGTVCTAPGGVEEDSIARNYLEEMSNWIDSGKTEHSLGFVQIRADFETLFISLERYPEMEGSDILASPSESPPLDSVAPDPKSLLLQSTPTELDFQLMSTRGRPVSTSLDLHNKSPVPIRIMRVSITTDTSYNSMTSQHMKNFGLQVKIEKLKDLDDIYIPAADSVKNALSISCYADADTTGMPMYPKAHKFRGSIIIRSTMDTNLGYDDWKEELQVNPYRDNHLTIEIPYHITLFNGRLVVTMERSTHPYPETFLANEWDQYGHAISALFFPMHQVDTIDDDDCFVACPKYSSTNKIRHDLRIMSNMEVPSYLKSVTVVDVDGISVAGTDSICARFNTSITTPFEPERQYDGFEDLGFLSLQYKFRERRERKEWWKAQSKKGAFLTHCFLNITSAPLDLPVLQVPLVIHSSEIAVGFATDPDRPLFAPHIATNASDITIANRTFPIGENALLKWLQSSSVGQSFLTVLSKSYKRRAQNNRAALSDYLQNLIGKSGKNELATVQPIFFEAGAIEHEKVFETALYFTNFNPIPMSITIDVANVEGMSIALGMDSNNEQIDRNGLLDFLPSANHYGANHAIIASGSLKGHSVKAIHRFLLSRHESLGILQNFDLRDAVSLSAEAVKMYSLLLPLYQWHSYAKFHQSDEAGHLLFNNNYGCDLESNHSSMERVIDHVAGAMMISSDMKYQRFLKACANGPTNTSKVKIPPGGIARFNIRIKAPPAESLPQDLTKILATGLILSTNFGHTLPIFTSFKALQGQIDVVQPQPSQNKTLVSKKQSFDFHPIHVPMNLVWHSRANDAFTKRETDLVNGSMVPFFIRSSFTHQVTLQSVDSCNPWFRVTLQNTSEPLTIGTKSGIQVGTIQAIAECSDDEDITYDYPSYYQCVSKWLTKRRELLAQGCGMHITSSKKANASGSKPGQSRQNWDTTQQAVDLALKDSTSKFSTSEHAQISDYVGAVHDAFYTDPSRSFAVKSGKRSSGLIDSQSLTTYAEVWNALDYAENSLTTGTSLWASLGFESEKNVSISMQDRGVFSSLKTPILLDRQAVTRQMESANVDVEFQDTPVGHVSSVTIPLQNPTSVPIRVRLATVSDKVLEKADALVKERFLHSLSPPFLQIGRIKSDLGEHMHESWWEGGGAFFLPDANGNVIRSHHNISVRAGAGTHVSFLNPSIHAISAFVVGCSSRCGIRGESSAKSVDVDMKQFSVIGASSGASTHLVGRERYSSAQKNDILVDSPTFNAGSSPIQGSSGPKPFALPYSSLDEIIIPPYGSAELGPILFRPPGRSLALGCDVFRSSGLNNKGGSLCDTDHFRSFVFLENSLTGLERVVLSGKGKLEKLVFLDSEQNNAMSDISVKNGLPVLDFSGVSRSENRVSEIKKVNFHNDGDISVFITSIGLYAPTESKSDYIGKASQFCEIGSFRLQNCYSDLEADETNAKRSRVGFELSPGESHTIVIEYNPDCKEVEWYTRLVVTYTQGTTEFSYSDVEHELAEGRLAYYEKRADLLLDSSRAFTTGGYHHCAYVEFRKKALMSSRTSAKTIFLSRSFAAFISRMIHLMAICLYIIFVSRFLLWIKKEKFTRASFGGENRARWDATFRCLARADPSSIELHTLGREQIRQVIAGRYTAKGGVPPIALTKTGSFLRERLNVNGGTATRVVKEGNTGDRLRTLSDALFRTFASELGTPRAHMPSGLGWRHAFSRGIITDTSIEETAVLRTLTKLQMERKFDALDEYTPESFDEDDSSASQSNSDFDRNGSAKLKERQIITPKNHSENDHVEASTKKVSTSSEPWTTKGAKRSDRGQEKPRFHENTTLDSRISDQRQKTDQNSNLVKESTTLLEIDHANTQRDQIDIMLQPAKSSSEERLKNRNAALSKPTHTANSKYEETVVEPPDGLNATSKKFKQKETLEIQQSVKRKAKRNGTHAKGTMLQTNAAEAFPNVPPPPGLAPPPGFHHDKHDELPVFALPENEAPPPSFSATRAESSLGDLLTAALNSDMNISGTGASSSALPFTNGNVSGRDMLFQMGESPLSTPLARAAEPSAFRGGSPTVAEGYVRDDFEDTTVIGAETSSDPLLDSVLQEQDDNQNGFDVMDFLDNILNESESRVTESVSALNLPPSESPDVLLASNPWASDATSSRAAAYGIAVVDSEGGEDSNQIQSQLPLLTPAAILMSGDRGNRNDDEDEVPIASFYSKFTDEK